MKKWMIPLAVMLAVPALGAAAPIVQPAEPEQLVEGHTVFTVIEQVSTECPINDGALDPVYDIYYNIFVGEGPYCVPQTIPPPETEYAAAVAVLVREYTYAYEYYYADCGGGYRFPGVLWFNDQYLVNPAQSGANSDADCNVLVEEDKYRYPCTGSVNAVNSGGAPPPAGAAFTQTPGALEYQESYRITDPNDHVWVVDKWNRSTDAGVTWADPIWTVAIKNNDLFRDTADDGTSDCAPYYEGEVSVPGGCIDDGSGDDSLGATPLRCSDDDYISDPGTATVYNAVLFFFLADLTGAGADKDHSVQPGTDVSGCDAGTTEWACPGGDDNAEGNSHPYNPCDNVAFDALDVCALGAGAGNHGGSGASGAADSHATRNVDIYYGTSPTVLLRSYRLTDNEGSTAPFQCHAEDSGPIVAGPPADIGNRCTDAPGFVPGSGSAGGSPY